jgi:formate dehydrogenase accessory protein FdhD
VTRDAVDETAGEASREVRLARVEQGRSAERVERVIEELPVALVYNGVSHAVMMATPVDLEDFALGFSLTEGIVASAAEVRDIDVVAATEADGIEVRLEIAALRVAALQERRRTLAGRTGCGLCGVESLREAVRPPPDRGPLPPVDDAAILHALDALPAQQRLQAATGGAHAAAWADRSGALRFVREDVGRHNALDKVIGAALRAGVSPRDGFAIVTSRASVELVQKLAAFGGGCLVAVSAPTAYAIRYARAAHVALVAFARQGRLSRY